MLVLLLIGCNSQERHPPEDGPLHTSSPSEGDWTGRWTLTADYTAHCDLGSETYHQILFVDLEDQDGTLVLQLEDYRMEGPDGPVLELFGTFPLSGHQEEVPASPDEDDTRIRLSAELLSDYRADGRLEGAFVDLDGALCELESTFVEMLR